MDATPATYRATLLTPDAALEQLGADWQALFESVPGAAWSCAPGVYRCYLDILRRGGDSKVIAVQDARGGLRGILPISRDFCWRGPSLTPRFDYDPRDIDLVLHRSRLRPVPVRQVTTISSLPGSLLWLGPLCRTEDRPAVGRAVARALMDLPGWDIAVLPAYEDTECPDLQAGFDALGAQTRVQRLDRNVQNIHNLRPFDAIVADQNTKFRQNVRRARKVAEAEGLRCEVHAGPEAVRKVLPIVADLARQSWKHEGRDDKPTHIAYEGLQQAFTEAVMGSDTLGGEAAVGIASGPEGPVACLTLTRMGETVTAILTFWNGGLDKASPGMLLLGTCIDWACARGATRFDMNTTAPWVRYLVDTDDPVCNLVVTGPTLRGRVLSRVARLWETLRR